jgi:hypothetical protein
MVPDIKRLGLALLLLGVAATAPAQLDPFSRELVQVGYYKELVGHAPISGYAIYYRNDPQFVRTNLTLRLAVSPVYGDGELGIKQFAGPNTDLGIGLNGGGYAYNYEEIREGKWYHEESWTGYGAGLSTSLYHLFNPGDRIPLYGLLRGGFQYAAYERNETTAGDFVIPDDQPLLTLRTGLRYGGQEFDLMPEMGMELSAWYEGQFRLENGPYGYSGDRAINSSAHLFWARALLDYTLPELKHRFGVALNAGTSIHPDRLSAYRVGGLLDLVSEFPYTLPGYYFGELSTKNMLLLTGFYQVPIDKGHHWRVGAGASTALFSYTPGLEMPNNWNSGVGGGITYDGRGGRLKISLLYGYGIDAIRSGGRGGHALAFATQIDLEKSRAGAPGTVYGPDRPGFFQRLMRSFK